MIGGSAIIVKACPTCPTGKHSAMHTSCKDWILTQALLQALLAHDSHSLSVMVCPKPTCGCTCLSAHAWCFSVQCCMRCPTTMSSFSLVFVWPESFMQRRLKHLQFLVSSALDSPHLSKRYQQLHCNKTFLDMAPLCCVRASRASRCIYAGASVDSYFLADYRSSAVQPPGRFTVLSMQAQVTPAGRLQAYFEIVLTQTADALRSVDLDIICALGELAGEELQASCGSINPHCMDSCTMSGCLDVLPSCCLKPVMRQ